MKRIIALVLALLVATFAVSAFAAEGATGDKIVTKTGTEINLIDWDNMNNDPTGISVWDPITDPTNPEQGNVRASFEIKDTNGDKSIEVKTCPYGGVCTFTMNPTNGAGTVYSNFVNNRGDNALGANTKAVVLKMKTDSPISFDIEGWRWNGGTTLGMFLCPAADVMLQDADGYMQKAEIVYDSWGRYLVQIPENFDGFVIIPTACFTSTGDEGATSDWNTGAGEGFVFFWVYSMFIRNYSETNAQATMEIKDMYVVNEALPTYVDGDYPTADLSVIAYAAATILGCGALTIVKKKRA